MQRHHTRYYFDVGPKKEKEELRDKSEESREKRSEEKRREEKEEKRKHCIEKETRRRGKN